MSTRLKSFSCAIAIAALTCGAVFSAAADDAPSEPPGPPLQVVDKLCKNGHVAGIVIAVSRPGVYAIQINHESACGPSI